MPFSLPRFARMTRPPRKFRARNWSLIAIAVLCALLFRSFAYEPFRIPSGSMIPTLLVGDYIFVAKFSYGYSRYSLPFSPALFSGRLLERQPKRGEVIVFRHPKTPNIVYVKRLIGLPGDRVQMKQGRLYINDTPTQRQALPPTPTNPRALRYQETLVGGASYITIERFGDNGPADNTQEFIVPPKHFFFMGDNRDSSQDSRFLQQVGFVPFENLVGAVKFVLVSLDYESTAKFRTDRFFTAIP